MSNISAPPTEPARLDFRNMPWEAGQIVTLPFLQDEGSARGATCFCRVDEIDQPLTQRANGRTRPFYIISILRDHPPKAIASILAVEWIPKR
ncbi:hypothetical protein KQH54_01295 [bacterium]|nr:hypothetical protein [bacterium]